MGLPTRLPDLEHWKAQVKCQSACPVSTDAGAYVQLIAEGRPEEAYLVARAPNPFASVCGRVCAAPCEDACRRGAIDAPISIRALKRYVTEQFGVESRRPDTQDRLHEEVAIQGNRYASHFSGLRVAGQQQKKVAIVGAGPAGLAAAHDLALWGYQVTVLEASEEAGGMMRFGIPEYRLPRSLIQAEIGKIEALGVDLRLKTPLTAAYGLAQLRAGGFAATFLSTGVQKGRELSAPGVELDGVIKAVDYLLNANRGYRADLGKKVLVIGGGFVAFDAARTALRVDSEAQLDQAEAQGAAADARMKEAFDSAREALRGGAREVTLASLESFQEMPVLRTTQGHEEFEETKKEGVSFVPRRGPKRFLGTSDGSRLRAVELRAVKSVFDAAGRFAPEYDDDDVITVDADSCILAIGQRADLSFLKPEDGVALTPAGTIQVDRATLATSAPGLFAGGDVAFGPRNLIEAVANGKLAARSIHRHLSQGEEQLEVVIDVEKLPTRDYRMVSGFEILDRAAPPTLDLGRRTGIAEVETGYAEAQAREQAARCLVCHVQTIYDPERCILCSRCVDVCPEHCLAIVPFDALDMPDAERAALGAAAQANGLPLSAMIKEDDRCIRCGLCAIRCPTDAMTMERFTITERLVSKEKP